MTTTLSTIKTHYLEQVALGLADLPEDDREEVIQDLRSHLAELDEDEVEAAMGSPDDFVAEFRASAGLDDDSQRARKPLLATGRTWLDEAMRRLAEVSRWQAWRPLWIWIRGWLLLSTVAVFSGGTAFRRFPIPTVEYSTIVGLALLVVATWLSVWLDRRKTRTRQVGSFLYSSVVALLLFSSLFWPRDLARSNPYEDEVFYPDQLIGPEGEPIYNIYAYDSDGNPLDVLLFDQNGRPLRSLPTWVYEEAEQNPGFTEKFDYGGGAVSFPRDEFGRIIPNLYPLDLYQYGEYGFEAIPPPSLGFPQPDDAAAGSSQTVSTTMASGDVVVTTTMPPRPGVSD
jgi:hypothetical protein